MSNTIRKSDIEDEIDLDKNTFKIDRVSDEFLENWSVDYFLVLFFSFFA